MDAKPLTDAQIIRLLRVARAVAELDLSCENQTQGRCIDAGRLPHVLAPVFGSAETACVKCHLWTALEATS